MSKEFTHGTKVEWDWGNGTGEGKIDEKFTDKVTKTIKGTEVTRNASKDDPAYTVKQDDGDIVLKSGGELRKASG